MLGAPQADAPAGELDAVRRRRAARSRARCRRAGLTPAPPSCCALRPAAAGDRRRRRGRLRRRGGSCVASSPRGSTRPPSSPRWESARSPDDDPSAGRPGGARVRRVGRARAHRGRRRDRRSAAGSPHGCGTGCARRAPMNPGQPADPPRRRPDDDRAAVPGGGRARRRRARRARAAAGALPRRGRRRPGVAGPACAPSIWSYVAPLARSGPAMATRPRSMHPAQLARALGDALPDDALVVYDGAHTSFWSNDLTPVTRAADPVPRPRQRPPRLRRPLRARAGADRARPSGASTSPATARSASPSPSSTPAVRLGLRSCT